MMAMTTSKFDEREPTAAAHRVLHPVEVFWYYDAINRNIEAACRRLALWQLK
jgi:hypothetical protein